MNTTLLGVLATAGTLGVTHAIEPDHVAGISSLTSRYGDPGAHDHGHGVAAYLKTGVVVALAVGAYTVTITATMSLLGAGVGGLFGTAAADPRTHGLLRSVAGVVVAGLAVSLFVGAVPTVG